MEVPTGEPLEDVLEDPMDEEKEGPMFEEPIEIEESEEEPMEENGQVARRELVTLMMEMTLMILILMVVMMERVVMVVMVMVMEETMEMGVMMIMMHYWLKGGPRGSTTIWRVMPTTTPSLSRSYAATTPDALFSTGWSIGPTPTTPASGR